MRPRPAVAASCAALLILALSGCAVGTGSAFGYGSGDGTGSTSSMPIQNATGPVVLGMPLDNRSGQPVQLLTLTPLRSDNITVGTSSVAPVLQERDGSRLFFNQNQPSDDPTLVREWARRTAAAGYHVGNRTRDLQALLPVTIRDRSRPARVVGLTITYRQDGRVVTESNSETFCFFPQHRESACSLP